MAALVEQGREGAEVVMPGFTHTRPAEPITFGHLAAAHAWGLVRDDQRLRDARVRVNVLPLGSGALAGSALDLDREAMARELGFEAVSPNALDAVSDRDFAVEFVSACAMLQTHLARLAEDLLHFAGPEHGFVELPEAFTTGSSLMPQKKNPDALELVRGKTARVDGDLLRLLVLLKGLPAGYQKDLQEDKEAVFDAADATLGSVAVMAGVVAGLDAAAGGHAPGGGGRGDDGRRPGGGAGPRGDALPQGPRRGGRPRGRGAEERAVAAGGRGGGPQGDARRRWRRASTRCSTRSRR